MLRNEALLARAQQANVRDVDPKEVPYDANYLATAIHEGMARLEKAGARYDPEAQAALVQSDNEEYV